ncbi:066c8d70-174e-4a5d-a663-b8edc7e6d63d [Thermothielavioides terrestris]|uniref:066c8d70-174e-4a5d-a663-b8edc7e6d63d n=1 Tax=Thermothielavioides terrestris TaxID=2587410 RepID=A0A446BW03_9PEZI|nr:066c8d70-174e-4a5d-a663-b8edc7e6d63d [Thermothielavioides terrestris]
MLNRGGKEL